MAQKSFGTERLPNQTAQCGGRAYMRSRETLLLVITGINGFSITHIEFWSCYAHIWISTWLSQPNEVGTAVKIALECGYRHIDCAHAYGNEAEIGEAFQSVFSKGTIKREDVFVTSKLWIKDFSHVKEACKLTLKNLQLDYLDLYLIHLPFELEKDLPSLVPVEKGVGVIGYYPDRTWAIWKNMEELVDEGLVKSIGISNYTVKKTENLLQRKPRIKPACNQVELTPYLPQQKLYDFCKNEGIALVAFAPLANPACYGKTDDEKLLLSDEVVSTVAKKQNATNAQVLLAWNIKRDTGVLAKTVNESRIKENFGCLDLKLDSDDMNALNGITYRYRYCKQKWALKAHEEVTDLWDGEYQV